MLIVGFVRPRGPSHQSPLWAPSKVGPHLVPEVGFRAGQSPSAATTSTVAGTAATTGAASTRGSTSRRGEAAARSGTEAASIRRSVTGPRRCSVAGAGRCTVPGPGRRGGARPSRAAVARPGRCGIGPAGRRGVGSAGRRRVAVPLPAVPVATAVPAGGSVPAPVAVPAAVPVAVPPEVPRTVDAEVRHRPPAPHPGRNHPAPADGRVVDVHVRSGAVRRHVGIGIPVRQPDPAVLGRVDPLPRRSGGLGWCFRLVRRRGRIRDRWGRRWILWRRGGRLDWLCFSFGGLGQPRPERRTLVGRPACRRNQGQGGEEREGSREGLHGIIPKYWTPLTFILIIPGRQWQRRSHPGPNWSPPRQPPMFVTFFRTRLAREEARLEPLDPTGSPATHLAGSLTPGCTPRGGTYNDGSRILIRGGRTQ